MKRIPILFLLIISAAVLFCGCAGESKISADDVFEYKGVVFSGKYNQGVFFEISPNSFYSDGLHLSYVAFDAATAFIIGDIERLLEHFDNDEYANEQIIRMENFYSRDLNELTYLVAESVNYDVRENDDGCFLINYAVGFTTLDRHILLRVDAYLNDNNEWKIKYIDWNIG